MEDILKKATKYQKERKWKQAIHFYEEFFKEATNIKDIVYVNYAKCLKITGDTDQAKEILTKGKNVKPDSEKILKELYNIHDSLEEWRAAQTIAEDLIEINPHRANNHFLLGRAYSVLRDNVNAKNSYKKGLEYKHDLNIDEIAKKVQHGFTDNPEAVSTEYIYISGFNNYGAFIHSYNGKKYFTKISRSFDGAKREETFYREVCKKFPVLEDIVPKYIDSQFINNVLYLTLEMIEDTQIDSEHTIDIIKTAQKMSSIPYEDIIYDYPNPNYLFQLRNKPTAITVFFTKIHEKKYNEKMFTLLYKLINQKGYPSSVEDIIERLETLILKDHLYAFIKPETHYSLMHKDFTKRNIKIRKQDGAIKAFDWAGFSIGPHFIPVARYLTSSLTPFLEVKRIYLDNKEINGNLTRIEKIIFLYALTLLYIFTLKEKKVEKNLNIYILPALTELEILVSEFMKYDFETEAKKTLNELNQNKHCTEIEVKNLKKENESNKQRIKNLEGKIDKLEKRHKNIVNSKSWKITKPFRKLTNGFKQ